MNFSTIDYLVFFGYIVSIVALGLFVSREKKGHVKDTKDYFLASKALPWWAVGASIIAANISAEQVIGMSGSGYAIGLAIASYEWMAALTLILVAKYFLPIFLEKGIYTMPQFLEIRYDKRVRTILAVFWLIVYIFVNLTSVLYLGSLALQEIMGIDAIWAVLGLAIFSSLYTIYGGLKAVAWTDVVQVIILVFGGLLTTYLAVDWIGGDSGFFGGLSKMFSELPNKFDMILEEGQIMIAKGDGSFKDAFTDLPGISVLIGGMWIANLFYWGCNQYITQRALAAKNIREAQRGLAFAGYMKLLMPLIVVIPGIAAYYIVSLHPELIPEGVIGIIEKNDKAYPWLLSTFVPAGFKGLAFAALIAAIVSSLSSMVNSTATIWAMDIYKPIIKKDASEKQLVTSGRIVSGIALVIAILVAPQLKTLDQAFQYIQEFTGFVSPGILLIFMAGLFWKKSTADGALWAAGLSIVFSAFFYFFLPDFPFMDRMGVVFIMSGIVMAVVSYMKKQDKDSKAIVINKELFKTDTVFNVASIGIIVILIILYAVFW